MNCMKARNSLEAIRTLLCSCSAEQPLSSYSGAGLILANPLVRRYLGQLGVGSLVAGALPDLDRYLKLRNM